MTEVNSVWEKENQVWTWFSGRGGKRNTPIEQVGGRKKKDDVKARHCPSAKKRPDKTGAPAPVCLLSSPHPSLWQEPVPHSASPVHRSKQV